MQVAVDLNLCQAYGVCAQIAPEIFDLDDDGYAVVPEGRTVPEALEDKVREAAEACPAIAVLITEDA
jgi:ferredoxin